MRLAADIVDDECEDEKSNKREHVCESFHHVQCCDALVHCLNVSPDDHLCTLPLREMKGNLKCDTISAKCSRRS
ncbi:hypothetical protein MRB53_037114 [Persea americana]|nr:hypothetical protein MRB53_037114 [Persea americana]